MRCPSIELPGHAVDATDRKRSKLLECGRSEVEVVVRTAGTPIHHFDLDRLSLICCIEQIV
jgi:hypothetical protein